MLRLQDLPPSNLCEYGLLNKQVSPSYFVYVNRFWEADLNFSHMVVPVVRNGKESLRTRIAISQVWA